MVARYLATTITKLKARTLLAICVTYCHTGRFANVFFLWSTWKAITQRSVPAEKGVYISDPPQAVLKIQRGRRSGGALDEISVLRQLQQRRDVLGLADEMYRIAFPKLLGGAQLHTHAEDDKHTSACEHNILLMELAKGKSTALQDPQAIVMTYQGVPLSNLRDIARAYGLLHQRRKVSQVSSTLDPCRDSHTQKQEPPAKKLKTTEESTVITLDPAFFQLQYDCISAIIGKDLLADRHERAMFGFRVSCLTSCSRQYCGVARTTQCYSHCKRGA